MRIISGQEWLCLIEKQPALANYLRPYVLLMPGMKRLVSDSLKEQKLVWSQLENKWSKLPDMIGDSMTLVAKSAKQEAHELWLDWDARAKKHVQARCNLCEMTRFDIGYGLAAMMGWVMLWSH
ncbi:MAG: hypothetical protein R8M46_02690 [Ghiorsea sp.]